MRLSSFEFPVSSFVFQPEARDLKWQPLKAYVSAFFLSKLKTEFTTPLASCRRISQEHFYVIPGKLAIASATRNPEIFKHFWIPVFTGMTTQRSVTSSAKFWDTPRVLWL